MSIEVKEVSSRKELKQFIHYPFQLYRGSQFWLPPIYKDEINFLNPRKNKALANADTILFLAYRAGELCGRVMGIINRAYNERTGQKRARFFKFDCINDAAVSHALLYSVDKWAQNKGMDGVIGPYGFSDKDPQGLLIQGFEQRAVIITPYNFPYYAELVENEGYGKEIDLVEYLIPVPEKIPDFYRRIYERVTQNPNLKNLEFRKKHEFKPYIIPILELLNETYSDIYGFVPLDRPEMIKFANDYMMILDPDFIKVVLENDQVISFIIAIPDLGPALQKTKGRLFPFGFIRVLIEMKRTDYLVLMLGGVRRSHQGTGLDVMMGTKMLESASRRGIKTINGHLMLETNHKVRAEMEKMGGTVCKQYRVYCKGLRA
ncbi:MAG: hypothetical protein K0B08_07620 [Bacteroidales bacterium]|nr:hypothetical protein [Bacteroidales bacterium]